MGRVLEYGTCNLFVLGPVSDGIHEGFDPGISSGTQLYPAGVTQGKSDMYVNKHQCISNNCGIHSFKPCNIIKKNSFSNTNWSSYETQYHFRFLFPLKLKFSTCECRNFPTVEDKSAVNISLLFVGRSILLHFTIVHNKSFRHWVTTSVGVSAVVRIGVLLLKVNIKYSQNQNLKSTLTPTLT